MTTACRRLAAALPIYESIYLYYMLPIQETRPCVDQQRMRCERKRMSDGTRGPGTPNPILGRKVTPINVIFVKYVTKSRYRYRSTPKRAHSTASMEPEEAYISPASVGAIRTHSV